MSREYQRLHEEATAVDWEIQELQESCRVRSAAELATLERRLDCLTVKRASLTKAMILLSSVEHPAFADEQRAFVSQLQPHDTFLSMQLISKKHRAMGTNAA
jgi:hypothetical protein